MLRRLFADASYTAVMAMREMAALAGDYIRATIEEDPRVAIWVGGSLGRREMLPNSDLDIFAIYPSELTIARDWSLEGFDRVEFGQLTVSSLRRLLSRSLIDGNQFIDGRALASGPTATEVERILLQVNTYDRQFANLITEHYYYRHFDFNDKRMHHGANVKYSSGSSRTTLFLNFYHRIVTGQLPARRAEAPEFVDGMLTCERALGIRGPYRALDLIQVAKNAAISNFDATSDIRFKYVSRFSLDAIYRRCQERFKALGIADADDFVLVYSRARREVEACVDAVVEHAVARHRAVDAISAIASASQDQIHDVYMSALEHYPDDLQTLHSYGAWQLVTRPGTRVDDMGRLARCLISKPAADVSGAMTALACSGVASAEVFRRTIDWALHADAGPYVLKLVSRNPHATSEIRRFARNAYLATEIVHVR